MAELPRRNVDTGAGLERIASILQNVPSAFQVDSMAPILRAAEEVTGKRYGRDPTDDVSLRVLTDHARSMCFLIADGVVPSNEGRGYVLRRLIRRGVRHARLAGVDRPVLRGLAGVVIDLLGEAYPELSRSSELVARVVEKEEARFDLTLRQGLALLEDEIASAVRRGDDGLPGSVVFKLHDTYGFPLDLTREIASEEGLSVDLEAFESLMASQRQRARAARPAGGEAPEAEVLKQVLALRGTSDFTGYDRLAQDATIVGLVRGSEGVPVLEEGQTGEVVLDRTSFYPEGGGQVGDRGEIRTGAGSLRVTDTRWGVPGVIVHEGTVVSGEIRVGQDAATRVDPAHREGVRQSHTATHMVHWALRDFLGEHAKQHGSLVEPGRLRFDFAHFEAVPAERLSQIEEEVNRRVIHDDAVRAFETTFELATSIGAMALFGEKYGDYVRVVEVGDYSKELCGGTHVARTGQVGVIKVLGESSIGAGLRRIEAFTGLEGLAHLNAQAERLRQAAHLLKVEPDRILERLERTLETLRALEAEVSEQKAAGQDKEVAAIVGSEAVKSVGGARLAVLRRDGRTVDELRRLALALRDRLGSGAVVIGSAQGGRANLVAATSRDLVGRGVSARELLAEGAAVLGGGAGGKPDLAVAGGARASEIEPALAAAELAARAALEAAG